ncbi:MAG: hypothetical protein CL916_10325, partial [Deltaproteobacteria bacterium]|nr:hypothetical protein [Deltaproteobacteria bacterium]
MPVAGLGVWTAFSRQKIYFDNIAQQQLNLSRSSSFYTQTWIDSIRTDIEKNVSKFKNNEVSSQFMITNLMEDAKDVKIAGVFDDTGLDVIPHQKRQDITNEDFIEFRSLIKERIQNKQFGFSDTKIHSHSLLYITPISTNEVLAVNFSLNDVIEMLSKHKTDKIEIFLISQTIGKFGTSQTQLSPEITIRRCLQQFNAINLQYMTPENNDVIASCSSIEGVPWYIFVGSDTRRYATSSKNLWISTLIASSIAVFISLLLSGLFIRRLTEPLEDLVNAARAIAMGGFGQRVYYHRNDEIGELADAFNMMSVALDQYSNDFQRQAEILSQTNADLQNRVDERTRELKQAQERLIQSARLAAVGEMGAGLAHSLNNPLSAVLGSIQILDLSYPDEELISMIQVEAKRCKEIIHQWLEASQTLEESSDRLHEEISLRDVIRRTSKSVSNYLQQRDVMIETSEVEDFIFWGDPRIIEQAFTQFFYALRPYVEKGNNIRV